ncbi:MAG: helix-turn-helix domain-containing protein [Clostridia bacterium]|nr:helix-turn-helix domain-containing protein [Clostridia bacterium]
MNEENKIGYYAIIPSTVLFNENLKSTEKLLYAVITILANKEGYCFASNSYLGGLLNAQPHTISKWVSNLKEKGFVCLEMIKNEKGEIIQRRIYPNDSPYNQSRVHPYTINRTYPYAINGTEGMSPKGQYNIISINMLDSLFNYIIKKEKQIPNEFIGYEEKIIDVLDKFELIYPQEIAESMREDIQEKFKTVCYALALAVKENVSHLLYKMNRDKILSLYDECKLREQEYKNTDNEIISFTNYFYKSLKGQLLKSEGSSFFMPKNKNIESESFNSEEDEDEEER